MYTKERTSNRRITLFFNLSLAAWSERKYHIRSVSKGFSQSGERGSKEGEREIKKKERQGFGRRKNCDRKRTTLDLFFVRRKKKKNQSSRDGEFHTIDSQHMHPPKKKKKANNRNTITGAAIHCVTLPMLEESNWLPSFPASSLLLPH